LLYGTGEQLRNPVYVDDAVEAFLLAGLVRSPRARVFNVGGREALSIRVIAEIIAQAGGSGPLRVEPFPDGRVRIDVGSCIAGTECIQEHLGWSAKTRFRDGIRRALDYYAVHLHEYVRRIPDSQVVHDTRP
jgi:nucleoside-diphosphate-sugar epimerase